MERLVKFLNLTGGDATGVSKLYAQDPEARLNILRSLSSRPDLNKPGIIPCDLGRGLGEILCLICLRFPAASEEAEPLIAASFLAIASRHPQPLPLITEDQENVFCAKTLVSLSVFMEAMLERTRRRAAPAPKYYRQVAKGMLARKTAAHRALGAHHEAWENFIHENFCV